MIHPEPVISVVILSYNRPHLLGEALASIEAQQGAPTFEVLLVDNDSPRTPEVRAVAEAYPKVRTVFNRANLGFTGGMNLGTARARGRFLYLTEDDVLLEPGCLAVLHRFATQIPKLGACAPLMVDHGSGAIRCSGGTIHFGGGFPLQVEVAKQAGSEPYTTGYIPGASVFTPRLLWEWLGGFRPDFFMYHEDVEVCQRLAEAGRSIWMVPQARARHFEPGSGPESPLVAFHKLKNLAASYLLHAPAAANFRFFLSAFPGTCASIIRRHPSAAWTCLRASLWVMGHWRQLRRDRSAWRRQLQSEGEVQTQE